MQPLLEAAHADLELREIVEVQDGSVHSYFHASSQYGNGTHSLVFASTPQGWGKRWAWLLLLWVSNSDGFGHFCGRRGSNYRYVAIEEGEAISKQTWLLFSWGLASNFR